MASIRKHPNSPFWIACFRDSNGSRTTRSTKSQDRNQALKMAVEWEAAAAKASQGRLVEAQARNVINSIMEHAGHDPITFYRTKDWFTDWLKDKERSRESTTVAKYKPIIERFLKHLGKRANLGLANINPTDIRSFRDLLADEGRAASTVNQIISKILSAPLNKATLLGYIPINPCASVEPLKKEISEAGVFSLEQVKNLLNCAPSTDWKGLILAGFYTGQRLRDLSDLLWKQVDLPKRMIFINSQQKTKVGVAIPIHEDLLAHFLSLPTTDNGDTPVFPTLCGKAGGGRSGLSEAFKRIMVKSGIVLKKRLEASGEAGRGRNELSFHSLRHSFNSVMANAGISQEIRQKLTGHRDSNTNKLYTHLDFPALEAAVQAVPSIAEKNPADNPKEVPRS